MLHYIARGGLSAVFSLLCEAVFLRFQDTTSATKMNWVHVAQSYFHDITPIHGLGIPAVWINRGGSADSAPLATVTLHDLTRLPGTLEQLIPSSSGGNA